MEFSFRIKIQNPTDIPISVEISIDSINCEPWKLAKDPSELGLAVDNRTYEKNLTFDIEPGKTKNNSISAIIPFSEYLQPISAMTIKLKLTPTGQRPIFKLIEPDLTHMYDEIVKSIKEAILLSSEQSVNLFEILKQLWGVKKTHSESSQYQKF